MAATQPSCTDITDTSCFQSPFHRGNGCYEHGSDRLDSENDLSVPFSSGQWLLPPRTRQAVRQNACFQSPFHRGNGCYGELMEYHIGVIQVLSVPFSSGQWLLPKRYREPGHISGLSVPFSSGQWLLLRDKVMSQDLINFFQSPFHRGNGCYPYSTRWEVAEAIFQSPFHRGNGCYPYSTRWEVRKQSFSPLFIGAMAATGDRPSPPRPRWSSFSPLFIGAMAATWQTNLPVGNYKVPFFGAMAATTKWLGMPCRAFSPLFIGAMAATESSVQHCSGGGGLSVPFSSGQWLLRRIVKSSPAVISTFQSPFHRGNGCYLKVVVGFFTRYLTFSPLFIGAMAATDLAIGSRNSSKRRNYLRLYIIRVILTHRRRPVNFKRSGCHIFSVHQCLGGLRVDIRKSLVCPRTSLGAHGTST